MTTKLHVAVGLVSLGLFGCGGAPEQDLTFANDLVPVTGSITLDGEPADSVQIIFSPVESTNTQGQRIAGGMADVTGTYTLFSPPGGTDVDPTKFQGALPGEYNVSFSRYVMIDGTAWNPQTTDQGPLAVGATESMPPKLTSPLTSGKKAKVEAGGGTFDFDLKSK